MSADNIIYIKKKGKHWHVWHDFASNDDPQPYGLRYKKFDNKNDAIDYAFKLQKKISYVEYGVSMI